VNACLLADRMYNRGVLGGRPLSGAVSGDPQPSNVYRVCVMFC
jgi:hypothetical protein